MTGLEGSALAGVKAEAGLEVSERESEVTVLCKIGPGHFRLHHMTKFCHAGVHLAGKN